MAEEEIRPGFTRVTKVLEKYTDFDKIDPVVLHKACERGTRVHRYAQLYAEGSYFPDPDKSLKPYVDSFIQWYNEIVEDAFYIEHRIYNDLYRLTGAIDLIARFKHDKEDCWTIVDYKTSSTSYKTWNLQTAAYKMLAEKYCGRTINRRMSLMLSRKGEFPKVIEYVDHERDWEIYKGILQAERYFS